MSDKENIYYEELKSKFENADLFNDKEKKRLRDEKEKSMINSLSFAKIFLVSYDTFAGNLHLVESGAFKKFLRGFTSYSERIRKLLENYGSGKEIGSHYAQEDLVNYVLEYRLKLNDLVNAFSRVVLEE